MNIDNTRVATRIAAVAAVPLIALFIYVAMQIATLRDQYNQSLETQIFAEQMQSIYALVHTLQVERGISAGFIGSKGAHMADALVKARQAANARMPNLNAAEAALAPFGNAAIDELIASSAEKLASVSRIRGDIDQFAITSSEAIAFYSNLIATMSRIGDEIIAATEDRSTALSLAGYVNVMAAKELAGQERGIGAGALGAGQFRPAVFEAFAGKKAAQDSLIARFFATASAEMKSEAAVILGDGPSGELKAMREQMMAADLDGLRGSEWFAAMTKWLGTLNQIGQATSDRIIAATAEAAAFAKTELTLVGVLAVILLAALAASVFWIVRSVVKPVNGLRGFVDRMAKGEFDLEIPYAAHRNEIGQMAGAVVDLREALKLKSEQDAEAERERSAEDVKRREQEAIRDKLERENLAVVVNELGSGLRELAGGNLRHRISTEFTGELDTLRGDFNEAVVRLERTLGEIGGNAEAIGHGSGEIRTAADDLARRTEQQAAAVEETAAALEQLTATVKDSTTRAGEANSKVAHTKRVAEESTDVVDQAVAAMGNIEKSSEEIGKIIGVIDEIAFQTNLLALNAGVEAARAGDAGKGFAVVAQEVRELAQRSANAAKEISQLIMTSRGQVEQGVALVGETGQALKGIGSEVNDIDLHIASIAEAAKEQLTALQEISTSVHSIDTVTQQNAAMVEETTAATHSLSGEVSTLNELLAQFQMGGGGSAGAAVPARPAGQTREELRMAG